MTGGMTSSSIEKARAERAAAVLDAQMRQPFHRQRHYFVGTPQGSANDPCRRCNREWDDRIHLPPIRQDAA